MIRGPAVSAVSLLALTACATMSGVSGQYVRVSAADLALEPGRWDGRKVETNGLLIWEFENLGLYGSYESYCGGPHHAFPIYVDWDDWPEVTRADSRRYVTVRGTFRHRIGVRQPDGTILISTGAPGPGPLEPGKVLQWYSPPLPACR